jgi:hypothetical protein
LAAVLVGSTGLAATPNSILETYSRAAGAGSAAYAASAARGRTPFTARHGKDWSCSTCHTSNPRGAGRHTVTGKTIAPLAPGANPERFSDERKVEKWFTRNCRDVLGRECTPAEKADIMAWLIGQG